MPLRRARTAAAGTSGRTYGEPLISRITGTQLHDYGCTLKAYDGELMSHLHLYGEQHRFIPALAGLAGARVAEIPVNHRTRLRGTSNYGISRTVRVLLDLMTVKFLLKYLARPMQFFGLLGFASFLLGLGVLGFLGIDKVVTGSGIADRPLLILGVLLTVLGVQFVSMGLLGELMIRVYHEVGRRTPYVVRATAGLRAHTEELEFPLVMPANGSRPPTAGTTTTADQTSHSAGSAPGRS